MPEFSNTSEEKLQTCNGRLQRVARRAALFTDFMVVCGKRTWGEQAELYEKGLSKLPPGKSKHNKEPYSDAMDLAPYPIDWKDTKRFYFLAGVVMHAAFTIGVTLRWGGDWDGDQDLNDQSFMDLGHFELLD